MSLYSFKPHHHFSQISRVLLQTLTTPLLIYFAILGNTIMFVSAYLFFIFEYGVNPDVLGYGDALWWALVTVSTVGYGDIYPVTLWGRGVGVFLILTGVMCFLSSLAVMVSVMTNLLHEEQQKK